MDKEDGFKWIHKGDDFEIWNHDLYECPDCHEYASMRYDNKFNFCPWCGKDMRIGGDDGK